MTGQRKKKTNTATVGRPDDYQIEATEFGHLIWQVAGFLRNSTTMSRGVRDRKKSAQFDNLRLGDHK
ncbi:MAG: hypothetical protein GEU79_05025 [Acidimicrobiia bacterium]|nr:hypothetical protein [Acidimicrobiia bacterium]